MDQLPNEVRARLFTNFLHKEFIESFKGVFLIPNKKES